MGMVQLSEMDVQPENLKLLPAQVAHTYHIVPYDYDPKSNTLSIAMSSRTTSTRRTTCGR